MLRSAKKLSPVPLLALAACAPLTAETDVRVQSAPDIKYSRLDTCETQREIEAYHSWRDSILKKKSVVYVPECAREKKPQTPVS